MLEVIHHGRLDLAHLNHGAFRHHIVHRHKAGGPLDVANRLRQAPAFASGVDARIKVHVLVPGLLDFATDQMLHVLEQQIGIDARRLALQNLAVDGSGVIRIENAILGTLVVKRPLQILEYLLVAAFVRRGI